MRKTPPPHTCGAHTLATGCTRGSRSTNVAQADRTFVFFVARPIAQGAQKFGSPTRAHYLYVSSDFRVRAHIPSPAADPTRSFQSNNRAHDRAKRMPTLDFSVLLLLRAVDSGTAIPRPDRRSCLDRIAPMRDRWGSRRCTPQHPVVRGHHTPRYIPMAMLVAAARTPTPRDSASCIHAPRHNVAHAKGIPMHGSFRVNPMAVKTA